MDFYNGHKGMLQIGKHLLVHAKAKDKDKVNPLPGSDDIYVAIARSIYYLIVEVGVLGVMQDCGTGCCGEDRTSRLAIDALEKKQ